MAGRRDIDDPRTTPSDHHFWRDDDVRKLKGLVDRHDKVVKVSDGLADHVEDIVSDTEKRRWWRGFFSRIKVLLGYIAAAIATTAAAVGIEHWWRLLWRK